MLNQDFTKISLNVANNQLEKIDAYAEEVGVNRSAAIMFIISNYFKNMDTVETLARACNALEQQGGVLNVKD